VASLTEVDVDAMRAIHDRLSTLAGVAGGMGSQSEQ
jgi:hypothetical protein